MTPLPVIVGFGGVGPAGRSSFHHAYRRTIFDSLDSADRRRTVLALAAMMGLAYVRDGQLCTAAGAPLDSAAERELEAQTLDGTLIRRLEQRGFDPDRVGGNATFRLRINGSESNRIAIDERDVPDKLPAGWQVTALSQGIATIEIADGSALMVESPRRLQVQAAGQLPRGFDPATLYNSRFHPRPRASRRW